MLSRSISASVPGFFLALILAVSPVPALAESASFTCTGISELRYQPGITNASQIVQVQGSSVAGPCTGTPAGIHSVRTQVQAQGLLSCSPLPQSPSSSVTLLWNDG